MILDEGDINMIRNLWYAILPSKEVKKDKIVGVKRLNLELALFRTSTGELGCVVDQCTHRGAALSIGAVVGDCIQCPFHALEFDINGKCMFIPANGRASTEDMKRFQVQCYLVKEKNGIIYLWYGDEEEVQEKLPFFDHFVDDSYVYKEMEDHWSSHYSRCIENQLDTVHVPIVHYNTIGKGNKTLINGPKVEWENGVLRTSANNEVDMGQLPKPASECVIKDTNLNFIFPNIWMNHISDKIKIIIYFAPVDDENTILYIRFYNKITKSRFINTIIAYIGNYMDKVIERQDKRVVITQTPKESSFRSNEKLISGDGPIIMYRKIRQNLKENNIGI